MQFRAQFVVVPPGAEAQVISCPICKESLKSEFLEEDEEWVWRNAVKKDDKVQFAGNFSFVVFSKVCLQIYHAEALASTSSIVARLRTEKARGSRSATPEVQPMTITEQGLRSTPPPSHLRKTRLKSPLASPESKVAGMIHKVEHTNSNIPQEANIKAWPCLLC